MVNKQFNSRKSHFPGNYNKLKTNHVETLKGLHKKGSHGSYMVLLPASLRVFLLSLDKNDMDCWRFTVSSEQQMRNDTNKCSVNLHE